MVKCARICPLFACYASKRIHQAMLIWFHCCFLKTHVFSSDRARVNSAWHFPFCHGAKVAELSCPWIPWIGCCRKRGIHCGGPGVGWFMCSRRRLQPGTESASWHERGELPWCFDGRGWRWGGQHWRWCLHEWEGPRCVEAWWKEGLWRCIEPLWPLLCCRLPLHQELHDR